MALEGMANSDDGSRPPGRRTRMNSAMGGNGVGNIADAEGDGDDVHAGVGDGEAEGVGVAIGEAGAMSGASGRFCGRRRRASGG